MLEMSILKFFFLKICAGKVTAVHLYQGAFVDIGGVHDGYALFLLGFCKQVFLLIPFLQVESMEYLFLTIQTLTFIYACHLYLLYNIL